MKRLTTALGLCVFLCATATLLAASYTWTGADDTNWQRYDGNPLIADNWHIPGFPGRTGDGDTALIAYDPDGYPVLSGNETISALNMRDGSSGSEVSLTIDTSVLLSVTGAFTVGNSASESYVVQLGSGEIESGSMSIDARSADANGENVTFELNTGTLDVGGTVALHADTDFDAEAMLWVASGSFEPNALDLNGGDSTSQEAVLDLDQSVTVQSTGSSFDGYCAVDIANTKTFSALATTVGAGANGADLVLGFGGSPGDGTFAASTLSIQGGDAANEYSRVELSDGSMTTSGALSLAEGSYANDHSDYAELYLGSDEDGCSAASMSAIGYSYVEITSGHTLSISSNCTLGHGAAADSESYVEFSGGGSVSIDGVLTIQGGSSTATTTLNVTNGSIQTY